MQLWFVSDTSDVTINSMQQYEELYLLRNFKFREWGYQNARTHYAPTPAIMGKKQCTKQSGGGFTAGTWPRFCQLKCQILQTCEQTAPGSTMGRGVDNVMCRAMFCWKPLAPAFTLTLLWHINLHIVASLRHYHVGSGLPHESNLRRLALTKELDLNLLIKSSPSLFVSITEFNGRWCSSWRVFCFISLSI